MEDEATRDALSGLQTTGSDLTKPLEMDFFVAVPSEIAGNNVALAAQHLGFRTSVEQDSDGEWTCYCSKKLVPSYEEVRHLEKQLDSLARPFGGYSDGFGSYGNSTD
ncbi:hypothetical protein GMSM_44830 [Geomonas sp. Red276]